MAKVGEKTLEAIRAEAARLAEPLGLSVNRVKYVREGGLWYLRIFIEHAATSAEGQPAPITLDDCALLHRPLADRLEELDPIKGNYYLEVSSLGSDEPEEQPQIPAHKPESGGSGRPKRRKRRRNI